MKINIIKVIAVIFLVGTLAVPAFTFAQGIPAASGGESTATASASQGQSTAIPAATGQGESTAIPAATGSNESTVIPGATGQNESTVIPGATGQGESTATPASSSNPDGGTTTPPPSGGGSSVSSGGSSYYSGGGSVTYLPPLTNVGQCLYMTTYLKFGQRNPSAEVTKLQSFLKNTEGLNVNVTGTFDQMTLNAVNAFQAKYLSEIMLPWGATTPSGYVYITTSKKINEIFCKKNFALTPAQVAEIEAYRTNVASQTPSTTVGGEIGIGTNPTPSINPATGEVSTSSDTQVAAVAETPIFTKIWNFIKRIFGR